MEGIVVNEEYKVIKEFVCHGKRMVIVRIRKATHIMNIEEWHKIMVEIIRENGKPRLIGIDLYKENNIIKKDSVEF